RALSYRIALKLASGEMSEQLLREISDAAYASDPLIGRAARAEIAAVYLLLTRHVPTRYRQH
ncbi:MAG: hypothetical protein F6K62_26310, partial [Sphaerospermopsis sp. SIO1G2]|nr:hypothetical protein [Sphaerospermopsis sp. SIO1G2]